MRTFHDDEIVDTGALTFFPIKNNGYEWKYNSDDSKIFTTRFSYRESKVINQTASPTSDVAFQLYKEHRCRENSFMGYERGNGLDDFLGIFLGSENDARALCSDFARKDRVQAIRHDFLKALSKKLIEKTSKLHE